MKNIEILKFYCQKILPLVYDESLSYYELLCKVVDKINEMIPYVEVSQDTITKLVEEYLTENYSDYTQLVENVTNLTSDVDELKTNVNNNSENIDSLSEKVDANTEDIAEINETVTPLVTDNTANKKRLTALETKYSTINGDITELAEKIVLNDNTLANHESKIAAIETDINEINTYIDEIDEKISNIVTGTEFYIFVGDSYAQGYSPDGTTTPWITHCKNLLGLADSEYKSLSLGGSGFASGDSTFLELLTEYAETLTSDELERKTKIIVCGGYNDVDNTATYSGVEAFIQYARDKFPNSETYVGMVAYGRNSRGANLKTTLYNYQSAKRTRTGHYLNGVEYSLHNESYLSSDGFHPNDSGQYSIACNVYDAIVTGSADVVMPYADMTLTKGTGVDTLNIKMGSYMQNAITTMEISSGAVYFESGVEIENANGYSDYITIATYSGGGAGVYGCDLSVRHVRSFVYTNEAHSEYKEFDFTICFAGGKLLVGIFALGDVGYWSGTIYGVFIPNMVITMDSIKQE